MRACGEADALQRSVCRLAQFGDGPRIAPKPKRVAGMRLDRERDIIEHAQLEKERSDLKRSGEAEMASPVCWKARNISARKTNGAGIGKNLAAELRDQCRLARSVGADHRMQLACHDVEAQIVGRDDSAEPFR